METKQESKPISIVSMPIPMNGEEGKERQKEELLESGVFHKIMAASLLYAVLFTFCLYQNMSGITVILWIISTVVYMIYMMKQFHTKMKKESVFYVIAMILLGVSTATTGNWKIIFLNYAGTFLLLLTSLLHNFYDDQNWGFLCLVSNMARSVFGAMALFTKPFEDMANYFFKHKKKINQKQKNVLFGLLAAIPFVIVIGYFLASADAVFAKMLGYPFQNIKISWDLFPIGIMFFFAFFSAYCGMRHFGLKKKCSEEFHGNERSAVIAITFTSAMTLLYAAFCMIQIIYLFIGQLELPDGMTYAGYARQGFFQLLFVCAINLVMVLVIKKRFQSHPILDVLLYAISGCTFIMIASSAYRMILYVDAYHLTFLRVFVLVALAVLSFLMLGIIVWIRNQTFRLTYYSILTVTIIYLCFSFSHIDYFIAAYNLSQFSSQPDTEDMEYITMLSTDAAPVVADYIDKHPTMKQKILDASTLESPVWDNRYWQDEEVSWYLGYYNYNCGSIDRIHLRTFNLSSYIASKCLIHFVPES